MKFKNWLFFTNIREQTTSYLYESNTANKDMKKYLGANKINKKNINNINNSKFSLSISEKIENIIKNALLVENEDENEDEEVVYVPTYELGDEDAKPVEELEDEDFSSLGIFRNLRDSMLNLRYLSMYLRKQNIEKLKEITNGKNIQDLDITNEEKAKKYKEMYKILRELNYLKGSSNGSEINRLSQVAIREEGNDYPEARVKSLISKQKSLEDLRDEVSKNLTIAIENDNELEYLFSQEDDPTMIAMVKLINKLSKRTVHNNGNVKPWSWSNLMDSEDMDEKSIRSLIINRIKGAINSARRDDAREKQRQAKSMTSIEGPNDDGEENVGVLSKIADTKTKDPTEIRSERKTIFTKFKIILDEMKKKYPLEMLLWCVSSGVDCYANLFSNAVGSSIADEITDDDEINSIEANPLKKNEKIGLSAVWMQVIDQVDEIPIDKLKSIGISNEEINYIKNISKMKNSGMNLTGVQGEINLKIAKIRKLLISKICLDPELVEFAQSLGGELKDITKDCAKRKL